jgi:hypothetical protein
MHRDPALGEAAIRKLEEGWFSQLNAQPQGWCPSKSENF